MTRGQRIANFKDSRPGKDICRIAAICGAFYSTHRLRYLKPRKATTLPEDIEGKGRIWTKPSEVMSDVGALLGYRLLD